jgi:hypothetical protein
MTLHVRPASTLAAVAALLWLAPASMASAQDVMQLDVDFKNSLSRPAHGPEVVVEERPKLHGWRHKAHKGVVPQEKRRDRR